MLTESQGSYNPQTSRDPFKASKLLTHETSESFLNYSLSEDGEIENKLKESIAKLRSNKPPGTLHTYNFGAAVNPDIEELFNQSRQGGIDGSECGDTSSDHMVGTQLVKDYWG